MLLRHRIKFPLLKKTSHTVKQTKPKPIKCNTRQLPLEIQEIICFMVLGEDASSPFVVTAMRVYTRVRRLIKYCPNITNIKFGQATSVKTDTLQLLGKYCQSVKTLQLGGIQSFPFMLDCDFSGMSSLSNLSLTATPIQYSSLQTIPASIRHLKLMQMDALYHEDLIQWTQTHRQLTFLSVGRCKHLSQKFVELVAELPYLTDLELYGTEINDTSLLGLFDIPIVLNTLSICHTQITDTTLQSLSNGRLAIDHLNIIDTNNSITEYGIHSLLKKKKFKTIQ
ncbi:hypothetical protein INT48_008544 [Thamnidium elegans]|uniref:Uncharacterized protein n=1 Tax=Thamnidium elegans TaxID=101142 RepID=A0A8H7SWF6_9FUNG|nr:hypothetical protein INT48_008544 [Thamnidium elegans]